MSRFTVFSILFIDSFTSGGCSGDRIHGNGGSGIIEATATSRWVRNNKINLLAYQGHNTLIMLLKTGSNFGDFRFLSVFMVLILVTRTNFNTRTKHFIKADNNHEIAQ